MNKHYNSYEEFLASPESERLFNGNCIRCTGNCSAETTES